METGLRIPEKLFFRIGEVCDLIKVQPHVLRYWETEFPMLSPQKNPAGQRVYRRKDVEVVLRIRNLLYEEKFTIAGAKKKLLDEQHRTGPRVKVETQEVRPAEVEIDLLGHTLEPARVGAAAAIPPPAPAADPIAYQAKPQPASLTPQARRALKGIKRDLEDLLTLLESDVRI